MGDLATISRNLSRDLSRLTFAPPVAHVYNPLDYASASHEAYLERYGEGKGRVILLGMNPGPFGMVQTGVPFGDVTLVRDWLGVQGEVRVPAKQHPARPIEGFACRRSEVSGGRLWGWARRRFERPERFFQDFFVLNYCPLAFLEEGGRNRTPDKLPATERGPLFERCDRALIECFGILEPRFVVGIGSFAATRARNVLAEGVVPVASMLHPSPASPRANQGWEAIIEAQLEALGLLSPVAKASGRPKGRVQVPR